MSTQALAKFEDNDNILVELEQTQKICHALMKTPHYSKLGEVGIFAIVQKAKSIGMSPIEALNGGMYFVQGKVEMQGQSMMAVIRQHGHSISLNERSTNTHVVMDGKRCDNGDSWTVEFSIDDAKRAGIFRGQWEKYPKVMCMWRCVSMLGRFLFSDILKGVYVQGEISEAVPFDTPIDTSKITPLNESVKVTEVVATKAIKKEEAEELSRVIEECSEEYKETVRKFLKKGNINSIEDLPVATYVKMKDAATRKREEHKRDCEYEVFPELTSTEVEEVVEE